MKPLILVDGSSYLYRAFHALPPLMNAQGQQTGAVYGVVNMIKKLRQDYQPEKMVVIFDSKEKTFRDELYSEYKATREAMPDDLRSQIAPLHELIKAMGIPLLLIHGVEADDVIGTLAKQSHHPVIISTGDKDMAQLVNKNISLINTMNNSAMDEQGVFEKFGVHPDQIIDYLTLIGDTSDNIPGVPGVGPKTAAKWLSQYKTLDNIIKHHKDIPGKIQGALEKHLPEFELCKKLVTIKCNVEIPKEDQDLSLKSPDTEKLKLLLTDLGFKSWLAELSGDETYHRKAHSPKKYHCVLTQADLDKLIADLNQSDLWAVDTETTSLHIIDAKIVGLSFCTKANEAYYIPVSHNYPGAPDQLNREDVLAQLKSLLENPNKIKIAHNAKYDLNIFLNYNIHLQGMKYDTMLESYLLDSTATRHDMDSLAMKYLGKKTITFEDVAGKGAKQITFDQVGIEEASNYAAEDADITFQLHETLWPRLEQHAETVKAFHEIEMPLAFVLAEMERHGVLIDSDLLHKQSDFLGKRLHELELQAHKEVGQPFNLASPKQLQEILFDKLGLPVVEKTPSGQPSTAENVLQELALSYPLPKIIMEHRTLSKLKSTYTDKLPLEINPKTHRVHTSYQQAVASTGRLSSTNPNLQNIPIRTEEGRKIRQAFIAPKNYKILSADYSQVELRLMAHLSQDKSLLTAFEKGLDIHSATASEIFDTPLDKVTSDQRRRSKAINFGLIYGMSAFGLAKQIDVERDVAQKYIDTYFARYPGVKDYMENTKKFAHHHGYVQAISGRKLHLADINARNMMRQKGAERAAINAPLQGSSADLIKIAMINLSAWLKKEMPDAYMIMQVHDELIFEAPENKVDLLSKHVKDIMENAISLSVPLVVDVGVGNNWDEAH
ncbi:MAG TPA: DNA polymerase I [Gammaproteobacteria bacterium]|nr:DNA polymerase I [Gammaproteobacteria bacterium]